MKVIVKLQTVQIAHQVVQDFVILNVLEGAVAHVQLTALIIVAVDVKVDVPVVPVVVAVAAVPDAQVVAVDAQVVAVVVVVDVMDVVEDVRVAVRVIAQ
jgi:hypothetical protein